MLRSLRSVQGYFVHATDGTIGKVDDFLFDDERFAVRYLVVGTGSWFTRRRVLISPIAIQKISWEESQVHVSLTRDQVAQSPDLDAMQPITRGQEADYFNYYEWPYYWSGPGLWGPAVFPGVYPGVFQDWMRKGEIQARREREVDESHLRSFREIVGYKVHATDREFGHVEDILVDDHSWKVQYVIIDTKNWVPSKSVMISPDWVSKFSWLDRTIVVDHPESEIQSAPEFDPSAPVNREVEERLYDYYGRPKYWVEEGKKKKAG